MLFLRWANFNPPKANVSAPYLRQALASKGVTRDTSSFTHKDQEVGSNPAVLLKALPLKSFEEIQQVKDDVKSRTIVILKITPLAQKNIEELKRAIEELTDFTLSFGGDIARLGEERIVITPPGVKIWRGEKSTGISANESRASDAAFGV